MNTPNSGGTAQQRVIRIEPVSSPAEELEESLYEVRKKIYPRALRGWFAGWRWALVWFTQLIFYGLPWLQWNGRQMVLFDLGARKFYVFGFVFWPQDFIYLTLLLICSALGLFLFTAIAGRLWCGYACPQTVYTEIFMWIERKVEGDRYARMKLDASPLNANKLTRKTSKHFLWIALALFTGLTFVGYFTPIRDLLRELTQFRLGPWESFWILFYGFATYGNAGWMREQVCKYMCPYARFQSAMFDRDTLVITYDSARGEQRGSRPKSVDHANLASMGLGDCIDCGICVQVCPTGIDIRQGLQYECIGCAACIDGCNQIMDKMNYPRGLIRYSTENALTQLATQGGSASIPWRRVFRPRVLVYTAILSALVIATLAALALRTPLKVNVIRDRGVMARVISVGDEYGWIENVYRLQIMNQDEVAHRYQVRVEGLPGLQLEHLNEEIKLDAASSRSIPVELELPPGQEIAPGSHPVTFHVQSVDRSDLVVTERSVFLIPHL